MMNFSIPPPFPLTPAPPDRQEIKQSGGCHHEDGDIDMTEPHQQQQQQETDGKQVTLKRRNASNSKGDCNVSKGDCCDASASSKTEDLCEAAVPVDPNSHSSSISSETKSSNSLTAAEDAADLSSTVSGENNKNIEDFAAADAAAAAADDEDEDGGSSSGEDEADVSEAERIGLAASCRDEGNIRLKNGDVAGSIQMYKRGLCKLKNSTGVVDGLEAKVRELKLALNLNLSLSQMKSENWFAAIRAASRALEVDKANVKGLFRRGMSRSQIGLLDEALADLIHSCKLEPTNVEARKEIERIKQRKAESDSRDKKAFSGLFAKTAGMYNDREEQMKKQKQKAEAKLKEEMLQYEQENRDREHKGEQPIASFDEWQKRKNEEEEKKRKQEEQQQRKREEKQFAKASGAVKLSGGDGSSSCSGGVDLDDEDMKIVNETKKMGYCYFNRKVNEEEAKNLQAASIIQSGDSNRSLSPALEAQQQQQQQQQPKALSTWNSKGTTYEEKDCSQWARDSLSTRLNGTNFATVFSAEGLNEYYQLLKNDASSIDALGVSAAKIIPGNLSITSVSSIDGDAHVVVLKGSKRYLYDFKFDVSWKLELFAHPLVFPLAAAAAAAVDGGGGSGSGCSSKSSNATVTAEFIEIHIAAASLCSSSAAPTNSVIPDAAVDTLLTLIKSTEKIVVEGKISLHDVSSVSSSSSSSTSAAAAAAAAINDGAAIPTASVASVESIDWLRDSRISIEKKSKELSQHVLNFWIKIIKQKVFDAVCLFEADFRQLV